VLINPETVSPVRRSKKDARNFYNNISRYYDWLGGLFERKLTNKALDYLNVQKGERVLEIGIGTGYGLQRIALAAGGSSVSYGIDISEGMIRKTRDRLDKNSLLRRVQLHQAEAASLPFKDDAFDAIFLSFTLELFDNPEIPVVLGEIRRVLKRGGRVGIVSLAKTDKSSLAINLYEWVHNKWPNYIDCRPIYLAGSVQIAGFKITLRSIKKLVILPVEIVIAFREV